MNQIIANNIKKGKKTRKNKKFNIKGTKRLYFKNVEFKYGKNIKPLPTAISQYILFWASDNGIKVGFVLAN